MSYRRQARSFFFAKLGRVPGSRDIAALAAEFEAAERRGEERMFAAVLDVFRADILPMLGREMALRIADVLAEKLGQGAGVTPLDGAAQPAEQVTDNDGGAALPTGGH